MTLVFSALATTAANSVTWSVIADVPTLLTARIQFPSAIRLADAPSKSARIAKATPRVIPILRALADSNTPLAEGHRLEKIKTIGDAYMVAGGMPELREGHAAAVAEMALDMLDAVISWLRCRVMISQFASGFTQVRWSLE
ncbi:adenylate/guanylate cyclase domain-containing protein [Mesorhizobium sp. LjNodule214]|uniref:adenylate/guanylate cyclase domain-containing protein n=1 Tax=Mesorhizobium sp. LjNodule214 TaxID=3342252 RepID=UPI003F5004C0